MIIKGAAAEPLVAAARGLCAPGAANYDNNHNNNNDDNDDNDNSNDDNKQ